MIFFLLLLVFRWLPNYLGFAGWRTRVSAFISSPYFYNGDRVSFIWILHSLSHQFYAQFFGEHFICSNTKETICFEICFFVFVILQFADTAMTSPPVQPLVSPKRIVKATKNKFEQERKDEKKKINHRRTRFTGGSTDSARTESRLLLLSSRFFFFFFRLGSNSVWLFSILGLYKQRGHVSFRFWDDSGQTKKPHSKFGLWPNKTIRHFTGWTIYLFFYPIYILYIGVCVCLCVRGVSGADAQVFCTRTVLRLRGSRSTSGMLATSRYLNEYCCCDRNDAVGDRKRWMVLTAGIWWCSSIAGTKRKRRKEMNRVCGGSACWNETIAGSVFF